MRLRKHLEYSGLKHTKAQRASSHDALASPLASTYDCEAGPCLGFQYWNGATMGTSTAIDIHQIYCYGCSFGGQQFYVKLYSRLIDTNYAVQGYTEAGYQAGQSHLNQARRGGFRPGSPGSDALPQARVKDPLADKAAQPCVI